MRIAIVGESLIDFTATGPLAFQGHEGGGPSNCAVAAARLGQATGYISQLSRDMFGERLFAYLQTNGVDLRFVLRSDAPTTLAFVERTATSNHYAFYMQGTADTLWAPAQLPELPQSCRFLQFGSIALLQEPAASRIVDLVRAERGRRIVVFDPNARPTLVRDPQDFRARCQGWLALADLVKLSDEDLAYILPGLSADEAAAVVLALGPRALVLTHGGQGATLYRAGQAPLSVSAPVVQVVDTIAAGDTFGAALMVGLLEQSVERAGQLAPTTAARTGAQVVPANPPDATPALGDAAWRAVLGFAAMAAALNCTRAGASPPTRAELDVALTRPE
ncbi:carbohydrate kinase [Hylemonella gracilis]|uniref:Carbohydrate kinase n=1 Tax=Hylemonella gracilis TaxID=80880 RepID=A0A4P6UI92_9BURK|nr:carbohydrate kinase [Hylemonella gracilis]QBK04683.1 carbohydrate kinase [Hylemonella gracilis]